MSVEPDAVVTDVRAARVHRSEDLNRFEAHLFPQETAVEATCPETGAKDTFAVRHNGDRIRRISTGHGYRVGRSTELFTEVAECFHIDRYWDMLEESDVQGPARRCYC